MQVLTSVLFLPWLPVFVSSCSSFCLFCKCESYSLSEFRTLNINSMAGDSLDCIWFCGAFFPNFSVCKYCLLIWEDSKKASDFLLLQFELVFNCSVDYIAERWQWCLEICILEMNVSLWESGPFIFFPIYICCFLCVLWGKEGSFLQP